MKRMSWKLLKGSAIVAASTAIVAACTIPVVCNSTNTNKLSAVKNDGTSDAVTYGYEPLTIESGYSYNVISSDATATKTTGYQNVSGVDDPDSRTNGTHMTDEDYNASCLFVNSTAGGTTSADYPGLPDPVNGFITINSEVTPTTTGSLYWKVPCSTTASVNNAMKLWGSSTSSTATDTFTFSNLGVYQKLYILCILSQCNGGGGQIKATINYTDGDTSSATYDIYDWFPSATSLKKLKDDGLFATDNYSRCWFWGSKGSEPTEISWQSGAEADKVIFNQIPITVNTSKVIESLTINLIRDSSYKDSTLTVYGVTGQYASNINAPTVSVSNPTKTGATVSWTAPTSGDTPEYYYLDVYHTDKTTGKLVYDISSKEFKVSEISEFKTTLSTLSESTKYTVVMRSGVTDTTTTSIVQSENSTAVSFTTLTGVSSVSVPDTTIYLGDTSKTLTTTCYGSDGATKSTTQTLSSIVCNPDGVIGLTLQSSITAADPQVYDIEIKKAGTVTVTATASDGGVTGTGTVTVGVKAPTIGAPTNITHHGFTANWTAPESTYAYTYTLEVSKDSSFASYDTYDAGDKTSYDLDDLDQETNYYYRVKANNSGVASAASSSQTATTKELVAPTISPITITEGAYKVATVNWNATTQATTSDYKYVVQISNSSSFPDDTSTKSQTVDFAEGQSTYSYTFSDLWTKSSSITKWYARVKVQYGTTPQNSDWSDTTNYDIPDIPANSITLSTSSITDLPVESSTTFTTKVNGPDTGEEATNQKVTFSFDKYSDCIKITTDESDPTKHTVQALKAIPSNEYITVTVAAAAETTVTATLTVKITFAAPVVAQPTNVTPGSFVANWSSVAGASKYWLVVKKHGVSEPVFNDEVAGTSQLISNLEHISMYSYAVRSYNEGPTGSEGIWTVLSDPIEVQTQKQLTTSITTDPEELTMLKGDTKAITTKAMGKDWSGTYYYATNQNVTNVTTGSITVTDGEVGTESAAHTIKADGDGEASVTWTSKDSAKKTKTTTIHVLKAKATAASNVDKYSFTANWEAIAGAEAYRLDVAKDADFNDKIIDNLQLNTNSYDVTDLEESKTYYYRVRYENVVDGTTYTSSDSNTIEVKTNPDVTGITLTRTSIKATIGEYDQSLMATIDTTAAAGKKVNWSIDDENIAEIKEVSSTKTASSLRIKGTALGGAVIKAEVDGHPELYKTCTLTIVNATIGTPQPKVKDITTKSFTTYWDAVKSATPVTYTVDVWIQNDDGSKQEVASINTDSTEVVVGGLKDNTTYQFTVTAHNTYVNATSEVITVDVPKLWWPIMVGTVAGGISFFILLLFGLYLMWKNSVLKTYNYKKVKKDKHGKPKTHDKLFRAMDKTIVLNNQRMYKRKNSLYTRFGTKDEQKRKGLSFNKK